MGQLRKGNIMNESQVSNSTTSDLIKFYNSHSATPVKRFSDRKAAERRVLALIAEIKDKTMQEAEVKSSYPESAKKAIAAAVSVSWQNPKTRASRIRRTAVSVEGHGVYKSVFEAFVKIGIPTSRHAGFRAALREEKSGNLTFVHDGTNYKFSIVEQQQLPA
jgi:hypothetical protein